MKARLLSHCSLYMSVKMRLCWGQNVHNHDFLTRGLSKQGRDNDVV